MTNRITHMFSIRTKIVCALGAMVVATSAGCAPDCSKYTGDLAMTLGAGRSSSSTLFAALADGASVDLERGNQGGQHFWLVARTSNACPAPPRVRAVLRADDGANLGFALSEGIPWVPAPDNQLATEPLAVPIQRENICRVVYQGATLEVTITDGSGRIVQRSVRIAGATLSGFDPARDCAAQFPDGGTTDASRG
ncbi:MAG: hypothetical protein JNK05_18265 [Myxococcales bacterium]|nr:hypothetical protein [Myxococcales bacterium]